MAKPGMIPISRFTESSMFGDSEIFAQKLKIKTNGEGRHTSAISTCPSSLFILSSDVIKTISIEFGSIYQEMEESAIQRFKFHELWIANNLRKYLARAVDGHNEEFDVEKYSDITDLNTYSYEIEKDES